jgi:hypothetical protein
MLEFIGFLALIWFLFAIPNAVMLHKLSKRKEGGLAFKNILYGREGAFFWVWLAPIQFFSLVRLMKDIK